MQLIITLELLTLSSFCKFFLIIENLVSVFLNIREQTRRRIWTVSSAPLLFIFLGPFHIYTESEPTPNRNRARFRFGVRFRFGFGFGVYVKAHIGVKAF